MILRLYANFDCINVNFAKNPMSRQLCSTIHFVLKIIINDVVNLVLLTSRKHASLSFVTGVT